MARLQSKEGDDCWDAIIINTLTCHLGLEEGNSHGLIGQQHACSEPLDTLVNIAQRPVTDLQVPWS